MSDQRAAIIEIEALGFRWQPGQPEVLSVPALSVAAGSRVFLRGPSGSGKSTLLGLIGGVLTPSCGELRVLGQSLAALGGPARDTFRADHIGFVFQQFNLVPYLSLLDNLLLPCHFSRLRRSRAAGGPVAQAQALLAQLGLPTDNLRRRTPRELSIGQQQRVAVARALMGAPALLIADEPTSALDTDARQRFMELLLAACDSAGTTLLFVSHDPGLAQHFDQILDMRALNQAPFEEASC